MASTIKELFAAAMELVWTSLSLGDGSGWATNAVDNSTTLYVDALIAGYLKGLAGSTDYVDIFVAASNDGGTTYSGNCTGSSAAWGSGGGELEANLRFVARVQMAGATAVECGPWSVAAAFGGKLPEYFVVVIVNESGADLSATEADCKLFYQGVHRQVV